MVGCFFDAITESMFVRFNPTNETAQSRLGAIYEFNSLIFLPTAPGPKLI
jgi:hypothetical protein